MTNTTIGVRENGPYKITGPVTIVDTEGIPFEFAAGSAVVLCRCGYSKNKPFCDASHREMGFEADDSAPRAT
jgi:CDGSH-type Zn-finger protein